MIKIFLKARPIKGSKRWQHKNGEAIIKPITTAPLSWLAKGRLGTKVKSFTVAIVTITDVGMWATPTNRIQWDGETQGGCPSFPHQKNKGNCLGLITESLRT
jgi:hypothetical protein